MSNKSLPAYLQDVLQNHVDQSQLRYDDELQGIIDKLAKLNNSVEQFKAQIKANKLRAAQRNEKEL